MCIFAIRRYVLLLEYIDFLLPAWQSSSYRADKLYVVIYTVKKAQLAHKDDCGRTY